MRRAAGWLLLVAALGAALVLLRHSDPRAQPVLEATIEFGYPRERGQSLLGIFPPTHVVDPANWAKLGIRVPRRLPPELVGAPIEVRAGVAGAYLITIGESLFLTQRPVDDRPHWRLQVPSGQRGAIRALATTVGGQVALGLESPGHFARLTWSDGRWNYVLFTPGVYDLETLRWVGASLR